MAGSYPRSGAVKDAGRLVLIPGGVRVQDAQSYETNVRRFLRLQAAPVPVSL